MSWEEIRTAAVGLAASCIVALVGKWFGIKKAEETRSAVTWAIEQGVAYAAERFRNANVTGQAKKQAAIEAAESLAPKALSKLDASQKSLVVDATYARMKSSLPHASAFVMRGEALSNQADEVSTMATLPRPAAIPDLPTSKTSPERPGAKR